MKPETRKEFFACLALKHTPMLGAVTWKRLLEYYGNAYDALHGVADWVAKNLANEKQADGVIRETWRKKAEEEYFSVIKSTMKILCWNDINYPPLLRHIERPPLCLYALGDISLLACPGIAIVGARKCSKYALEAVWNTAWRIADAGIVVVSGLAKGIDRQAHVAALHGIGKTIAVLGCGLDIVYPEENRALFSKIAKEGLIISEYPPKTKPSKQTFPERNRIISGISLAVLVAEASSKSGSLITARYAMEQGREVFAFPGNIQDENFIGSNTLIQSGAILVQNANNILEHVYSQIVPYMHEDSLKKVRGSIQNPDVVVPSEESLGKIINTEHVVELIAKPQANTGDHKKVKSVTKSVEKNINTVKKPLASSKKLSGLEKDIYDLLAQKQGKMHIDDICVELVADISNVSIFLLHLELASLIEQHAGMFYSSILGENI